MSQKIGHEKHTIQEYYERITPVYIDDDCDPDECYFEGDECGYEEGDYDDDEEEFDKEDDEEDDN